MNTNGTTQNLVDTTLISQPNRGCLAFNTKRANQVAFTTSPEGTYTYSNAADETFPLTMLPGEKYDVVSDAYNNLDFNNMTFSINQ